MKTYRVIIKYLDPDKDMVIEADGFYTDTTGNLIFYKNEKRDVFGIMTDLHTSIYAFNKDVWKEVEEVE